MARNLMKAGYALHVHSRTRAKADGLVAEGAAWEATPAEVAGVTRVIITMVGYPADVEAVYRGSDGILSSVREGSLLIDMTTSSPALARELHAEAEAKGCRMLDAPVSGGDVGAEKGTLSIMAGGDAVAFKRAVPVFEKLGKQVVHQGPAGSGQFTKMANQIAIASGMLGVCEAITFSKASGLDPETVLRSISGGAAGSWSLSNLAPRMLRDDLEPGFYVKHFLKDLSIALEAAGELKLDLPGLTLAQSLYQRLSADGYTDKGTQALIRLYRRPHSS